jgi:uncharacterized protein
MKCPVCNNVNLVMAERQGIEIDYCPDCRGVWLDRGELDKIIERSSALATPQPDPSHPSYGAGPVPGYGQGRGEAYGPSHGHGHSHKPYRKKSFLEELFD